MYTKGQLVDWWDDASRKKFNEKAQCIVDQYTEFRENQTGLYLDGRKMEPEIIADGGGIGNAYKAYGRHIRYLCLTF